MQGLRCLPEEPYAPRNPAPNRVADRGARRTAHQLSARRGGFSARFTAGVQGAGDWTLPIRASPVSRRGAPCNIYT